MILPTIVATATPPGEGGIAIIRLSGSKAKEIAAKLLHPVSLADFRQAKSRQIYYSWLQDPGNGEKVDEVLAVWMQAPTTYTGEDVVEIQGHGGMAAVQRILELCLAHGAILAEPGEFTKRAFLLGRIDLTQAEAVMDLVKACSSAASRQAVKQLAGTLGVHLRQLSGMLLQLYAMLEAWIDFSDEIGELDSSTLKQRLEFLQQELQGLLDSYAKGRIQRQGIATALIGLPNVGKSTLFNAVMQTAAEAAKTTAVP